VASEDAAWEAFYRRLRQKVEVFGWAVQAVFAVEEGHPEWAYTIGLHHFGHPEIIVTTLPQRVAHNILNNVGEQVKQGQRFEVGPLYDKIIEGYGVTFRPVPDVSAGEWFNVAHNYWGGYSFDALQLVWPDKEGRFPWQAGYSSLFQPLLEEGG
jgi:hypothetical protein